MIMCHKVNGFSLVTALMCVTALPAFAQTASQITADSYAPDVIQSSGHGVKIAGGRGQATPAGAENLLVTPSKVIVDGGMHELADDTAAIEAQIAGKRVTAADLFKAARDLEAAYARAGFILARVSVPPQIINDGQPLHLKVTHGFIEAVDNSALSDRVGSHVAHLLAPLVGQQDVTREQIERQLMLAGDTPGLMLRSVLKAGKTPGGAIIVVEGKHNLVTSTVMVDNSYSSELGTAHVTYGADLNSPTGHGEVIYARIGGYPGGEGGSIFDHLPRSRQLVAGFSVPLGTHGFWFNMEAVDSRTDATSDQPYRLPDHYQRLAARLGYHWLRSRNANLATQLSFDVTHELQQLEMSGSLSDFSEDRLRVLRLVQQGNIYLSDSSHLSGSMTLSQGLDALGARGGTTSVPLSRDGAAPDFTKLDLEARFQQTFAGGDAAFSLAAKAQYSFGDPLVASEQIGLGGMSMLSAYDSGAMVGDSGLMARGELALPRKLSLFSSYPGLGTEISPYLFGAAGLVSLEQPTAAEEEITRAVSVGAGLRFALARRQSSDAAMLTLEYAHGDASHESGENRFNISLTGKF